MKVIKWAMRHGSLYATEHDDLNSAVYAAEYAAEAGTEAVECIEVFESGAATSYDSDAVFELRWSKMKVTTYTASPKPVAVISVRSPDGKWVDVVDVYEPDDPNAVAAEWRADVGADRVTLVHRDLRKQ